MTTPQPNFDSRIRSLRDGLAQQGRAVLSQLEAATHALFAGDEEAASKVVHADDRIDQADVETERSAVALLEDATREGAHLDAAHLRSVLTVVKSNNELERVADACVDIARLVAPLRALSVTFPPTFRVMANSVVGILRDVNMSLQRSDPSLAKVVLQSQHAVTAFKDAILRDAEEQIARGTMRADAAFLLHEIANLCELMADHCTNIAEQVIYETTGRIVRHTEAEWIELPQNPPPPR